MSISTPVALGTLWALVFSGITGILLIIRTVLEDNTLKRELDGYEDKIIDKKSWVVLRWWRYFP